MKKLLFIIGLFAAVQMNAQGLVITPDYTTTNPPTIYYNGSVDTAKHVVLVLNGWGYTTSDSTVVVSLTEYVFNGTPTSKSQLNGLTPLNRYTTLNFYVYDLLTKVIDTQLNTTSVITFLKNYYKGNKYTVTTF